MSKLVKKIGNKNFYEIDGIRAGGIIPYYIKNNKVYLLINKEYRKKDLVYNITGGKVDEVDNCIEDTQIREFNEETGFLVSNLIERYKNQISKNKFYFKKPKYVLSLININQDNKWINLAENYNETFKNVEKINDRDSEELEWIELFNFNGEKSYLLKLILSKLKNINLFRKYNPNKCELFID
jgi:8-oxo-dGTP pyrophosphatase MutT (NUDIX family)